MSPPRLLGLTLVEVLVSAALLALFATTVLASLTASLRLQAEAGRITARVQALQELLPGDAAALDALPSCPATPPVDGEPIGVCRESTRRCNVTAAGAVQCSGGPLRGVRLRTFGPSGMEGLGITVWTWHP